MSVTVTLNAVDLDAEGRRARALRAAELIGGLSWAIDELISECAREMIATGPHQTNERDDLHADIRAAMGLKAKLLTIVQDHEAENTLNERRTRNDAPADHD